jgi:hypothetical protein
MRDRGHLTAAIPEWKLRECAPSASLRVRRVKKNGRRAGATGRRGKRWLRVASCP